MSCGGLRTLDVIVPLEKAIGVPVVSSTPHGFWHCARMLKVPYEDRRLRDGHGRLSAPATEQVSATPRRPLHAYPAAGEQQGGSTPAAGSVGPSFRLPYPGRPALDLTRTYLRRGHVAGGAVRRARRRAAVRTAAAARRRLHQHLELRDLRVAQHVLELTDDGIFVRLPPRLHLLERRALTIARCRVLLALGPHGLALRGQHALHFARSDTDRDRAGSRAARYRAGHRNRDRRAGTMGRPPGGPGGCAEAAAAAMPSTATRISAVSFPDPPCVVRETHCRATRLPRL